MTKCFRCDGEVSNPHTARATLLVDGSEFEVFIHPECLSESGVISR